MFDSEEINEMMKWLGENMDVLPTSDQLALALAFNDFINQIKPIYIKNIAFDSPTSFLFKL